MPGVRPKLMFLAASLIAGGAATAKQGYALKYQLENAYRVADRGKPSRVAHYKRLAKKRANIRARSKK